MSRSLEFEGKNIDGAIKKACKSLRISKEELKYDVISYGSTGIFGLVGSKKAKIRVKTSEKQKKVPAKEGRRKETAKTNLSNSEKPADPKIEKLTEDKDPVLKDPVLDDELKNLGKEVLEKIVESITSDFEIEIDEKSDGIFYRVNGGNSALLIGKRGQTLESIQYLVEKVVNRRAGKRLRIDVDVEGYLQNRRNNLIKLTEKLSEKVKSTGKPVTIGQMNAYERRIVHIALRNEKDVRTQSKGDGLIKKISIFPKKNQNRKRK